MIKIKYIWLIITLFLYSSSSSSGQWEKLNEGLSLSTRSLTSDSTTDLLYVFGTFDFEYEYGIDLNATAAWADTGWVPLGSGIDGNGQVFSSVLWNGNVVAGGNFEQMDGVPDTRGLAIWDGNDWSSIGSINDYGGIADLRSIDGELIVLGDFDTISGIPFNNIAKWNGVNWSGFDNADLGGIFGVYAAAQNYQGELYVGGNFSDIPGLQEIVKWNGTNWESLDGGILGGSAWVNDLEVFNGKLIVAGRFFESSGNAADGIMAWDGAQWSPLFDGLIVQQQVDDILVRGDTLYFCGGYFRIQGGDTTRYGMGYFHDGEICLYGGPTAFARRMEFHKGDMYFSTSIEIAGTVVNHIAKWDLSNPVDTCIDVINTLPEEPFIQKIRVWPNPAQNNVSIALGWQWGSLSGQKMEVYIYSIQGSLEDKIDVVIDEENTFNVSVNRLKRGVYMVSILDARLILKTKLVLE